MLQVTKTLQKNIWSYESWRMATHQLTGYLISTCSNGHHAGLLIARVCGTIRIQQPRLMNKLSYNVSIIHQHTLNIAVKKFRMLYSPLCHINYLMTVRDHECEGLSHYCGDLPPWNESSPTSNVIFTMTINWPNEQVEVTLQYTIQSSVKVILYQTRPISHNNIVFNKIFSTPKHLNEEIIKFKIVGSAQSIIKIWDTSLHGNVTYITFNGPRPLSLNLYYTESLQHI